VHVWSTYESRHAMTHRDAFGSPVLCGTTNAQD
jgi:hypothetical protein